MERIAKALRTVLRHLRDSRGVSLYEITAAVAMTGILAAVAVPVIIDRVSEAKAARAVQETDAIYRAMTSFQRDTGKMPGEGENIKLLVSDLSLPLPDGAASALAGLDSPPTITGVIGEEKCTAGCASLNTYLVTKPDNGNTYQNWRGPYIDELKTDPFDRTYVVNVRPLYTAEGAGCNKFGYGWVLSAGPDRVLATKFADTKLNSESDDVGKNNGKRIGSSMTPCTGG